MIVFAVLLHTTLAVAQEGIIKGKVTNGNENIHAATVSLGNNSTLTDVNGEFSFIVKAGKYTLTITHAGYNTLQEHVSVLPGTEQKLFYSLNSAIQLGEVVILGSRFVERNNLNTAVPVDVFSADRLRETGQVSLTQMLNFLAPSFTASREVLNEPATLRGLDPQHVLILIDGIRYHPMAWMFSGGLKGQLGKGSVGNDLNSIPFPAVEKIEVLRDGAAAQYGSDAIGGVINIVLKKNAGTSFQTQFGEFYKGDGAKFTAGLYHGFLFKKKNQENGQHGFMNISGYYRSQAATFRGGTYEGLIYLTYPTNANHDDSLRIKQQDDQLVSTRGFNRNAVADNAGNTGIMSGGFVMNSAVPLNSRVELFATTIVNSRKLNRAVFFRLPRDSSRINYILYPDGVQPRGRSNTVDVSAIAGIKGKTGKELSWEIISNYGINSVKGFSTNSYNVTQTFILGKNAQTSFNTGTDVFEQLTTDINLSKQLLQKTNQPMLLNIGWGGEWRIENYQTKLGEEAWWKNYDTANFPLVNEPGKENILNKSRNVLGAYVELESEFKNSLFFNIAGRYEYYSDFGGNLAGKIAARYKLFAKLLLRASVNNGFRAPSLQQRYATSVTEGLNTRRETIVGGTFPNTHEVTRALNIAQLTAERSINISGGVTSAITKNISLTVDAYWLQIKNRIVLSGNFVRRPGNTLDSILDLYPNLQAVNQVAFFSNAINTKTKGIDIVLDGYWANKKESLGIKLAANFNSNRLYGPVKTSDKLSTIAGSSATLFNSEDSTRIERGQPGSKIILFITYKKSKTKLTICNTRFGKTTITPLGLPKETFPSKIITDVSVTYLLKPWLTCTVGANNIANVYPGRLKNHENTFQGGWIYSPEASPFGFNGGYYYLGIVASF